MAIAPASLLRAGRAEDCPTGFKSAQGILRDQEDAFAGDSEGVPRDLLLGDYTTDINVLPSEFEELLVNATEAEAKMAPFGEPEKLLTTIARLAAKMRELPTTEI